VSQLTKYIEKNKLLPRSQSAYRHGHSTETALLKVYSDLTDAINRGDVLLGLLDMSAAFDTVDYGVLLERLTSTHGIAGMAHKWIRSYLSDRSKTVIVDNVRSHPQSLT